MTREAVLITDVDGNTINLNDRLVRFCKAGRLGAKMPTFGISSTALWEDGGSILDSVVTQENNIVLPVLVQADGTVLEDELRYWSRVMNPHKGEVTILVTRPDASARELNCRYIGGLESLVQGQNYANINLSFRANDPYWRATSESSEAFTGTPGDLFFPFTFPFYLDGDNIFDSRTVVIAGDVATYPRFVITGSGTSFDFRNNTTGKRFKLDYNLAEGEQIVINFDPRRTTPVVTTAAGSSLFRYIDQDYLNLWSLTPDGNGVNELEFLVLGTTAGTTVTMYYTNRYLSS